METKFYFYKITNILNDMYYFGVHKSEDIENDNYLGSGTKLKEAIEFHGRKHFKREILSEFNTKKEVLKEEKRVVTKDIVDDDMSYNLCTGGGGWPDHISSETKEKLSKSAKKRFQDPEQYNILVENRKKNSTDPVVLKKISNAVKKAWENPEFREKMTRLSRERGQDPEERERRRERTKRLWQDPEYRKKMSQRDQENKKKSPEHRKKLSEAAKRQWQDPEYRKKVFKDRYVDNENYDPLSPTIACQHCKTHYPRSNIRRHERHCELNPNPPSKVVCCYCENDYSRNGITSHMKICPQRPTD